ncbi:MAG: Asp-tRNA(Asn)/Glu-tRNA(Gln) amidotransferase subunit GatC [Gammaproteobacteria bacterium]|jgi:aspartyl-tRNA(Asn)/glutamyl-tRNA(Gln) amidotransferase subunit C|nr:Asp-tRNA(Asn)/Glu-tRNA(Gln) amidotransferase GatCAB subunit C [Chromatiales bacterium]MCP4925698.1 Asp-tRNA(Asn)/Glu-tRNA(Gln) amidotransferase subunit GatC [Gammaproteobacteria bacterium]MDP7152942.1 Asp-tRNA(Asn)/Glu-tRNA(Gln) amidotransferase subunit GatC [Gammaproteobacteria bacterium]MDP7297477.1 Asp-tRNA(Asn)/Glu-tRNA(Gln) amidotransferase subunit GatC [Gammaproteobacteria bacterium]MDP7418589.1 Asp-tRNA(Asn)/Glu-tRNA(Gln) amidotransferase subunit GatC [Gammaproteobacteria bacterium]
MALSKSDVAHIAQLARLEVSDDEITDYVDKLSSIIDLVAKLGELDTSAVLPMAHPHEMSQRLRPDEATETDQRESYQRNAQAVGDGFYRVPRVIE